MQTNRSLFRVTVLACVCLLWGALGQAQAQATKSPLPPPAGYVNDYAQVIDSATANRMETILANLKQRASIEFAVVTLRTTGDQPIFDYSLAVARGWGIGSPDGEQNGALLLVAVDDRKYQIQISRHLEDELPDGLTGEIGRRMREPFRRGDYSTGLMNAVQTFVATLAQKRGFSIEGIDQRYAYENTEPRVRQTSGGISICGCAVLIIILVIIILISSRGGGGGCLNLLLLNALFNSGGGRSSGWSGGGFGGAGGDGGGFSGFGGGGDFGGGGAGGDW